MKGLGRGILAYIIEIRGSCQKVKLSTEWVPHLELNRFYILLSETSFASPKAD